MTSPLPETAHAFMDWTWEQIAPHYDALAARPLTSDTVDQWLKDWSQLSRLIQERGSRLSVAKTLDTADTAAEAAFNQFLETIFPPAQAAEQQLRLKLLESGLEPDGMGVALAKIRADVELYREENLPLFTAERKLSSEYDKLVGAQSVEWAGQERTLTQLKPFFTTPDRATREAIWRLKSARQLQDRDAINENWQKLLANRLQQAANASMPDYRRLRWQMLKRFDYTPDDSHAFRDAIAEVVVPAAGRIYEQNRRALGVDRLRPWDVDGEFNTLTFPALTPYVEDGELDARAAQIFQRVDPVLGDYFATMRREGLLDLPNRKGKAPGGYCTTFALAKRPFIFMNAVGAARDVNTMLHEAGHAFHVFEASRLPYLPQMRANMEFNEVASMAMELLAAPYLAANEGGYYSEVEAARHRLNHLEKIILFWPYMAVVDAFQHWVYEHPAQAANPAACDATWDALWQQFIPAIDWTGLETERATGWHRKQHIHRSPFYYIEYGMAQLGAVQVWRNALADQSAAVARYRRALALGGTVTLPELYAAAGARFTFDVPTLTAAGDLIEETIAALRAAQPA